MVLVQQQVHPDVAIRVPLYAGREQGGNMPQPLLQEQDLFRHQPRLILRPIIITNNDRDGQLTGPRTEQQSNPKIETTEMKMETKL